MEARNYGNLLAKITMTLVILFKFRMEDQVFTGLLVACNINNWILLFAFNRLLSPHSNQKLTSATMCFHVILFLSIIVIFFMHLVKLPQLKLFSWEESDPLQTENFIASRWLLSQVLGFVGQTPYYYFALRKQIS